MPPELVQCHKCHTGHAKWRSMSPSATPATQSDGRCRQKPRLPRKVTVDVAKATPATQTAAAPTASTGNQAHHQTVQCHKCHACHAECTSMSPSATPATQSDGPCRQVQQRRPLGTKRATRASPVPHVPRLPRKVTVGKVFVSKLCV